MGHNWKGLSDLSFSSSVDRVFEINDATIACPELVYFAGLLQSAVSREGDRIILAELRMRLTDPGYDWSKDDDIDG